MVGQRLQPGHVRGEGEAAVADRQGGVGIDTLHDRMVPRDERATVDGGIGGGEGAGGQAGEGRREPNAHAISARGTGRCFSAFRSLGADVVVHPRPEQRVGDGQHHRSDEDPDQAKSHQAADHTREDEQERQIGPLS